MQEPSRWLPWTVVAASLAGLVWFVAEHSFSLYDDAYIYFRYADNLQRGCGPTFNCGEAPVEGFTSPVYLLLLWFGAVVTGDVEAWSQVLGTCSMGLTLGLAVRLAHRRGTIASPAAGYVAALGTAWVLTLDDHLLHNAVSGLETGLAAAAVLALAQAVLRRDGKWTVVWAVTGVLLRPECGVFLLLLPMLPWMRTRRRVLEVVLAGSAIVGLRYAVFGDLAPNTYWAKAGGSSVHFTLGVAYLRECVAEFPLLLGAPLVLWSGDRQREHGYLLLGMASWCAYFLRSGGDHFAYARLVVPLVPTATVLALVGFATMPRPRDRRVTAGLAGVISAVVGLRAAIAHDLPAGHGFANVQRWVTVGRWLRMNHPGEPIATVPVGAIAYTSGSPTLDLVGITSREVARGEALPPALLRRHWLGHERHATQWVLEQEPALIVTTKYRGQPWRDLSEARAGFYADWSLLQEIKAGRAPYEVYDAEVEPGVHWLMFRRTAAVTRARDATR